MFRAAARAADAACMGSGGRAPPESTGRGGRVPLRRGSGGRVAGRGMSKGAEGRAVAAAAAAAEFCTSFRSSQGLEDRRLGGWPWRSRTGLII